MEWSGRAPAPPAREAGKGTKDEEHAMSAKFNYEIAVIGIDIGKNSFHVVGLDRRGAIVLRQKWSRRIMATCGDQHETVPDRVVEAQALPDMKERAD
jgi:hypothetical protein